MVPLSCKKRKRNKKIENREDEETRSESGVMKSPLKASPTRIDLNKILKIIYFFPNKMIFFKYFEVIRGLHRFNASRRSRIGDFEVRTEMYTCSTDFDFAFMVIGLDFIFEGQITNL